MLQTIYKLGKKRQENYSDLKKKLIVYRTLFELADFLTPKILTENERKGRSSGSLSWRLDRGEKHKNTVSIIFLATI